MFLIDFGLLEFKARYALQTIPGYLDLPEDHHHKGCYNGATVKTSDGQYLVVELSGKSMNPHAVDMLGGIIEKPLEIGTGKDVFNSLSVELKEEGCIKEADIEDFYLRSVFLTPNTHTCFYFEVTLNVTAQELLERFAQETEDQDIKSLKALPREEYMTFLTNHNSPTKQYIAEIIEI